MPYAVFQGLLTAIIALFFWKARHGVSAAFGKFLILFSISAFVWALIRRAPISNLKSRFFQGVIFLADSVLATLFFYWFGAIRAEAFLVYFVIILGSAIAQNLFQSFIVAVLATVCYGALEWGPGAASERFLLHLCFLWASACLVALLVQETRDAREQDHRSHLAELFEAERLASLGQMAAEVAHNLKGPLTTVMVNAEMLEHGKLSESGIEEARQIREEAMRCREILDRLLNLGRIEDMRLEGVDLAAAARNAVERIQPLAKRFKIKLIAHGLEREAALRGNQALLEEAVYALLQNAVEAMPKGGDLRIKLSKGAPSHRLSVEDSGVGFSSVNYEKMFKPFYSTKGERGHGLGLSAVKRIIQRHSGSVEAESRGLNRGARFTLSFPAL